MGISQRQGQGVSTAGTPISREAVERALDAVIDPCSRLHGAPYSLVSLGMVREIVISDTHVEVELLLDDPTCAFFFDIGRAVTENVGEVQGVETVHVSICSDELWSEDRIDPEARRELDAARAKRWEILQRIKPLQRA